MGLINYIDIDWPDLFKPILTAKRDAFNRIRINREVIPIIFVPGIMGSRLKNKRTGESVWDPDREIMCMLRKYGGWWNTPAQRKRMLIGDAFHSEYLEVNENDSKHNKKFLLYTGRRADRGWGGVFWGSYGNFLEQLQLHKWDKPVGSNSAEKRKEIVGKCFEFPVHAFGYNWTDSNSHSGRKLADKIAMLKWFYKSKGRLCKYVILVSHSMGGLVCRSACKLHGAEKDVLGVIHGVQPATGAAAAYWRMKAGFERATNGGLKSLSSKAAAWVLGTDGEEVTCILGNAPGGLELLPNHHYTDNEGKHGWLRVPARDGKDHVFPRNGDPYAEIYKVKTDQFWRLINPAWLAPRDKRSPPTTTNKNAKDAWDQYIKCVELAEDFHKKLHTASHHRTYQFYSSSLNTVDRVSYQREKFSFVRKKIRLPSDYGKEEYFEYQEPSKLFTNRGDTIMYINSCDNEIISSPPDPNQIVTMSRLRDFSGGGDGTVPESSASALQALNTVRLQGLEHQEAYEDQEAVNFVLMAVRNLALMRIKECEVASAK